MGVQAWLRTFNGPLGILGFLPQAIAWTQAHLGYEIGAHRFVWITKWWTNIGGWIFSLGNVYAVLRYLFMLDIPPYSRDSMWDMKENKKGKLMAGGMGWGNFEEQFAQIDWVQVAYYVGGSWILAVEAAGWVMFYYAYVNSLDYGQALEIELAESAVEEEEPANDM